MGTRNKKMDIKTIAMSVANEVESEGGDPKKALKGATIFMEGLLSSMENNDEFVIPISSGKKGVIMERVITRLSPNSFSLSTRKVK